MNKTTKTILALGLGAAALYLIFKPTTAKAAANTETVLPPYIPQFPQACAEGEVPCTNQPVGGRPKCYNPNVDYIQDPCK